MDEGTSTETSPLLDEKEVPKVEAPLCQYVTKLEKTTWFYF